MSNLNNKTAPMLYNEGEPTNQGPALTTLIADILTITQDEAKKWIAKYEKDAETIYNILVARQGVEDLLSRKWRQTVIALLPLDCWVPIDPSAPEHSPYLVEGAKTPPATLWHSRVAEVMNDFEKTKQENKTNTARQAEADRKVIMEELTAALSEEQRKQFSLLVSWYGDGSLESSRQAFAQDVLAIHSGRQDINLWVLMDIFEECISIFRQPIEKGFRKSLKSADDEPTNPRLIGAMEALATQEGYQLISETLKEVGGEFPNTENKPGHLLLTVLCNLAANRLLLERYRLLELGKIGAELNVSLLKTLAQCDIHKAPLLGNESFENGLREVLTQIFGPETKWSKTIGCKKGLKGVELDNVIYLGEKTFNEYFRTRGRASAQHSGSLEKFLSVLALAACWYKRENSLPNINNPSSRALSTFPVNSTAGKNWEPTAEHMELYKIMFGQLLYGNTGFEINPDSVAIYSKSFRERHACMQDFLFHNFKKNPPHILLTLASCSDEKFKRLISQRLRLLKVRFEDNPPVIRFNK